MRGLTSRLVVVAAIAACSSAILLSGCGGSEGNGNGESADERAGRPTPTPVPGVILPQIPRR